MTLPTLYKKTSTGKIQMWKIEVPNIEPHDHDHLEPAKIITVYGQKDGKQQTATDIITEGKNRGKVNETTPFEQACAEAQSQWEKKVKKGYVERLEDAEVGKIDTNMITGGVNPMLAHSYDKQGHKITFPAYVQPKLDGHRCIAIIQDGKATLWSRTRKPITGVPHIVKALEETYGKANLPYGDSPGYTIVLDGELYNHSYREKFEELTSLIRQVNPKPGHEVVQYWVYDTVTDEPQSDRIAYLQEIANTYKELGVDSAPIVYVDTQLADNEDEMINIFGAYLNFGFEGLMVRNANGRYKHGRSYDLQKVKVFADAEYEIVDITEGRGKMAGRAMFHCVTPEGKEFRVKMMGALDDLVHYLDHKDDYIGRELTVKYQKFSADGIPIFPVGVRIREDV